jgi:predicted nucleic acid-binding protein
MKLVDSSAWIEFLRRKGDPSAKNAVARLIEAEAAAYTCPIRFELLSGARPGEEADLEAALQFSHRVPFEQDDWPAAARLERHLREKGVTIPRNDLFVATVALRTGLTIACRDAHFDAIRQNTDGRLKVEQI